MSPFTAKQFCFNPCYAGSKIESLTPGRRETTSVGFNPCYAGSKIESENDF